MVWLPTVSVRAELMLKGRRMNSGLAAAVVVASRIAALSLKGAPMMQMSRRLDTLDLEWFGHPAAEVTTLVSDFLGVLRNRLPEAHPITFRRDIAQTSERIETVGPGGLARAWQADYVSWLAVEPVFRVCLFHLPGTPAVAGWSPSRVAMSVDLAAMDDPPLAERLRAAFVELAVALHGFYACGMISQNMLVRNGDIVGDGTSYPSNSQTMWGALWRGLPARHPFIEWFGSEYAQLVNSEGGREFNAPHGLLVEYGRDGSGRGQRVPYDLLVPREERLRAARVPDFVDGG
jgi:hypothetical protein